MNNLRVDQPSYMPDCHLVGALCGCIVIAFNIPLSISLINKDVMASDTLTSELRKAQFIFAAIGVVCCALNQMRLRCYPRWPEGWSCVQEAKKTIVASVLILGHYALMASAARALKANQDPNLQDTVTTMARRDILEEQHPLPVSTQIVDLIIAIIVGAVLIGKAPSHDDALPMHR